MPDTKMLEAKQEFKEIHDSYVIFITENDVLGRGFSLYHIERIVKETGASFDDGSHIIYVNGSYKNDNDPVGKLMHDFRCASVADMFYSELAKSVRHLNVSDNDKAVLKGRF